MPDILKSYLLQMAIQFMLRQLGKWKTEINWALVKKDAEVLTRKTVPGTWFDPLAVSIVIGAIDKVELVIGQGEELAEVVALVVEGQMEKAWKKLAEIVGLPV